jgi:hypothetical protein
MTEALYDLLYIIDSVVKTILMLMMIFGIGIWIRKNK